MAVAPVVATMISTAMALPCILLVPRRLISTRDGEAPGQHTAAG